MDSGLIYRAYRIWHDGTEFVAEPEVSDYPVFEIGSQSVDRLMRMIDELYAHLEIADETGRFSAPEWFSIWLRCEFPERARCLEEAKQARQARLSKGSHPASHLPVAPPRRGGYGRARRAEAA